MRRIQLILLLIYLAGSQAVWATKLKSPIEGYIQPTIFSLTMVMLHDVVNPPAASRFYTYALVSAQSILSAEKNEVLNPKEYIKGFPTLKFDKPTDTNIKLAALYSILETGRLMLPSGFQLETDQQKLLEKWKKDGYADKEITASVAYAKSISPQIVAWSKTDGYLKLSTLRRYRPLKGDAYWYPTPPAYMEAVEPNWKTIKPMVIDSAAQFKPVPPVAYSAEPSSEFYGLAKEVYEVGKSLSAEQRLIAAFWDCNPFAVNTSGHMSIGFKKMSPGGHWMNITSIACNKINLPFEKAIVLHSLVATTLMDAFISCWDEKYRSNRIRPETVINRFWDIHWQPLLQTPPFPEYTSGHSVISTASAEVLTYFLGDNFAYTDDSEIYFDLKPRDFTSFRQAANEAAVSRLYGGIHYMDAITNGQSQGRNLGNFMLDKLKAKGVKPFFN
ncbi:vanadium-dependent haloperoxidase [Flectobacillus longus]|uniref:vanadium-dependent haloperoxidase n=1 Tax=Flectobacillus longus TaxID=2984207 RepID=UPI0024B65F3A|nr:vanadium-dependent haloperoxidase [Flectobacillus longus]MDI9879069.1 vanadium-dependent haloperoxidase [Flectobacillus longus]